MYDRVSGCKLSRHSAERGRLVLLDQLLAASCTRSQTLCLSLIAEPCSLHCHQILRSNQANVTANARTARHALRARSGSRSWSRAIVFSGSDDGLSVRHDSNTREPYRLRWSDAHWSGYLLQIDFPVSRIVRRTKRPGRLGRSHRSATFDTGSVGLFEGAGGERLSGFRGRRWLGGYACRKSLRLVLAV